MGGTQEQKQKEVEQEKNSKGERAIFLVKK